MRSFLHFFLFVSFFFFFSLMTFLYSSSTTIPCLALLLFSFISSSVSSSLAVFHLPTNHAMLSELSFPSNSRHIQHPQDLFPSSSSSSSSSSSFSSFLVFFHHSQLIDESSSSIPSILSAYVEAAFLRGRKGEEQSGKKDRLIVLLSSSNKEESLFMEQRVQQILSDALKMLTNSLNIEDFINVNDSL